MNTPNPATKVAEAAAQLLVDDLVAEHVALKAQADQIAGRLEQIANQLRELGPGKYDTSDGSHKVTVNLPNRFDPERARQVLTPDLVALCTAPAQLSPSLARQVLAPALYQLCTTQSTGKATVTVR